MTRVFCHDIEVSEEAIDEGNHVNNVVYVQWMQDAAMHHADDAGCTRTTREAGAAWVARAHFIEYLRPAFAGDRITVMTWIASFRRARCLRKYKFVRVGDGTVVSRGETTWVFVDADTGRPRNIPDSVRNTFKVVSEDHEP